MLLQVIFKPLAQIEASELINGTRNRILAWATLSLKNSNEPAVLLPVIPTSIRV